MTGTDLLGVWRDMARIRIFDEEVLGLARRGLVPGAVHPSTGHELPAAGVLSLRAPEEWVVSYYRCHGHALCCGTAPESLFREILGRAGGCCAGKGGSMHLADHAARLLGASSIVASHLPIAAGVAASARGSGRAVVVFFGDGALGAGPALETLHIARHLELPLVLVCEDNGWQDQTRSSDVRALAPEAVLRGADLTTRVVAEDDLDGLLEATAEAFAACREGAGPRAVVVRTYLRHFHMQLGPTAPAEYRPADEVATRTAHDPLHTIGARLTGPGLDLALEEQAIRDEIGKAVSAALLADEPNPATAAADLTVFAWDGEKR